MNDKVNPWEFYDLSELTQSYSKELLLLFLKHNDMSVLLRFDSTQYTMQSFRWFFYSDFNYQVFKDMDVKKKEKLCVSVLVNFQVYTSKLFFESMSLFRKR